jgi:hypothetical protein
MRKVRLFPKAVTGATAVAVGAPRKLTARSRILMRVGELKINLDQLIASSER